MKKYKEINGTSYNEETTGKVIQVLERCRQNRIRIIIDYGDTKTGKSWGETFDTTGYVGRSSGPVKVPILLHNSKSSGGGAILDSCIIGIKTSNGGKSLYQYK